MSRLGETIRAARVKAKMTEKALAKKCGLAESVIKEIESGRRIASERQTQQILKVLGVQTPVSAELEEAQEPEVKLRPKPRPYILPVEQTQEETREQFESNDAWLDALGGVVKRVPVMDEGGLVIDHVLVPTIGSKIEGASPDKVFFYRCPDNSLRGFRIHAGDLLLTVPEKKVEDGAIMVFDLRGRSVARKATKLDGNRVLLQSFESEFASETLPMTGMGILGKCVKLERRL